MISHKNFPHNRLTRRSWCIRNIVVIIEHFVVVYLPKDDTDEDYGTGDMEEGSAK